MAITVEYNGKTNTYWGLSSDTKPITATLREGERPILNGSIFYEMNTGFVYMYDEENTRWIKQ